MIDAPRKADKNPSSISAEKKDKQKKRTEIASIAAALEPLARAAHL